MQQLDVVLTDLVSRPREPEWIRTVTFSFGEPYAPSRLCIVDFVYVLHL
jgi:hypothetical protein